MARVVKLVSDITGTEADEGDFVKVVVRSHPLISEPKQLDALPGELDKLKPLADFVVLEIGDNGSKFELTVSHAEFKKLVGDDVVKAAPGTRGRRPGFSPKTTTPKS